MTDEEKSIISPDATQVSPPASEPDSPVSITLPAANAQFAAGSAAPMYTSHPPMGAKSYALGFLAYIPIPFIGLLIGAIVMIAVYPSSLRQGGIAAENAKRAANWGVTVIAVMVALILWVVLLATVFAGNGWSTPLGPILAYLALCLAHLVVLIIGLVQVNAGKVFQNPIAIPFLR